MPNAGDLPSGREIPKREIREILEIDEDQYNQIEAALDAELHRRGIPQSGPHFQEFQLQQYGVQVMATVDWALAQYMDWFPGDKPVKQLKKAVYTIIFIIRRASRYRHAAQARRAGAATTQAPAAQPGTDDADVEMEDTDSESAEGSSEPEEGSLEPEEGSAPSAEDGSETPTGSSFLIPDLSLHSRFGIQVTCQSDGRNVHMTFGDLVPDYVREVPSEFDVAELERLHNIVRRDSGVEHFGDLKPVLDQSKVVRNDADLNHLLNAAFYQGYRGIRLTLDDAAHDGSEEQR